MANIKVRENGYYWVCVNDTKDWSICLWWDGKWEDELDTLQIIEIDSAY